MSAFAKRLIFCVGLSPVVVYAFFEWLILGHDSLQTIEKFAKWCGQ